MSEVESVEQGSDGEMTATAPTIIRPRGSGDDMPSHSGEIPSGDHPTLAEVALGTATLAELSAATVQAAVREGADQTILGHLVLAHEALIAAQTQQRAA